MSRFTIGSGCVSFNWVASSVDFSLARTSLCFREGWFLYAITGGSGKIIIIKYGLVLGYFPVFYKCLFESMGIIREMCFLFVILY